MFGINASVNYRAYDAAVFLGSEDLQVTPEARPGEFVFRVAPRGAGVLELSRRPLAAPRER